MANYDETLQDHSHLARMGMATAYDDHRMHGGAAAVAEQRNEHRVHPQLECPIRVDINGPDFIDVLIATDISPGGLGLQVDHEFAGCNLDELVSIIIQLPYPVNESVSVMGRIIHLSDNNFGVQFVGVESTASDKIRRYVSFRSGDLPFWRKYLIPWFGH